MEPAEQDFVGLTEICDGNLSAMFAEALDAIAKDFADPRKPKKAKRVINFKVELDFDENGRAKVASNYDVKLPAPQKIEADGRLYVSVRPGKPIAISAFKPEKQAPLPGMSSNQASQEERVN